MTTTLLDADAAAKQKRRTLTQTVSVPGENMNEENMAFLRASIAQLEAGNVVTFSLDELLAMEDN